MKRSVLIVLSLLLITNGLLLAGGWTQVQLPTIQTVKWGLKSVSFPEPDKGWTVGWDFQEYGFWKGKSRGLIMHYHNGSWDQAEVPDIGSTNWQLSDVCFPSPTEGWAVGRDQENKRGVILHNIENVWKYVKPPSLPYDEWTLYDVEFLDPSEGWAVGGASGEGAVLLHYRDGTWTSEGSEEQLLEHTLLTVYALNSDDVWTGGFKDGSLSGIDIGLIGQPRNSYELYYMGDGWLATEHPLLLRNIIREDYFFFSPKDGWAVGWMPEFREANSQGRILHYNGKKWKNEKLPKVSKENWQLEAIDFSSKKYGWAVGHLWSMGRDRGVMIEYKKGKWSPVKKKKLPKVSGEWALYDVVYDGSKTWWTVGQDYDSKPKGIILKYTP